MNELDTDAATSDETSVYRYYDKSGFLIYVGITGRGTGRNAQHNRNAQWWPFVARQEVEHYATRHVAHTREKSLIREFRPPFNIQHNPDAASLKAVYLAFRQDSGDFDDLGTREQVKALSRRLPLFLVPGSDQILRTSPIHASLAQHVTLPQPVPIHSYKKFGRAVEVTFELPFLYIRGNLPLPPQMTAGWATLKWAHNHKPDFLFIAGVALDVRKADREEAT